MDQVVVVLDGADVVHIVTAVGFPGHLFSAQGVVPGFPLIRPVHTEGVGGQEGGHRNLPGPVDVKAVHAIENPCLDRIEHLKGSDDGACGKSLDREFPIAHLTDHLAEFLKLHIPQGTGVPSGLNLQVDGIGRPNPSDSRKSERAGGSSGYRSGGQELTTGHVFGCFLDLVIHTVPPLTLRM